VDDVAAAPSPPDREPAPPPGGLRFRLAFYAVASIVVVLVVMLPFAATSLFNDLFHTVASQVFTLVGDRPSAAVQGLSQVHVGIVDMDEARLSVTLRVEAHRACPSPCRTGARIVLFSVGVDEAATAGMPPSAHVDLPVDQAIVSASIELPIHGHPTLYPYDVYDLRLGVGLGELEPNQPVRPLTRAEGQGLIWLTVQEVLAREVMSPPIPLSPDVSEAVGDPFPLQSVTLLRFTRPIHERVLAVLLVVLIAAAAAYAVFMRPLHDLVINSGALVLGVWGIRSLLTPGTASRTLIDLSLSLVILFLLGAITFRALQFLYVRGGFARRRA
jgi:hypothetical protein